MVATSHRLVTPRDIARILFRHWQKMATFFCSVIVLTLIVIAVYPAFLFVGVEAVAAGRPRKRGARSDGDDGRNDHAAEDAGG